MCLISRLSQISKPWTCPYPIRDSILLNVDMLRSRSRGFRKVDIVTSSMETFSALLVLCAGNSPVTGEFPAQRAVTRSVCVFIDQRLNKRLSIPLWGWWIEKPSRPLWCHCNGSRLMLRYSQLRSHLNFLDISLWAIARFESVSNACHNVCSLGCSVDLCELVYLIIYRPFADFYPGPSAIFKQQFSNFANITNPFLTTVIS